MKTTTRTILDVINVKESVFEGTAVKTEIKPAGDDRCRVIT